MSYLQDQCCVLLADVTGSTALYSRVGDVEALAAISGYIDSIKSIIARHNGEFIHSRGDDVFKRLYGPDRRSRRYPRYIESPLRGRLVAACGPPFRTRRPH